MAFMELYIYQKGALYSADCTNCGATIFHHEWVGSYETRPEALSDGTAPCDQCATGHADPATVERHRPHYAARYSADGYMDCTDWHYGTNRRELVREMRDLYGEDC